MKIINIILQFVISGTVVVCATLIAKHVDPKWAGLIVALPIMTLLSLIFISIDNTQEVTSKYLYSAILFMIPAAIYIACILVTYNRVGLLYSLLIAMVPFVIATYIIQRVIN